MHCTQIIVAIIVASFPAIMGTAPARTRSNDTSSIQYLRFVPHSGFGNQIIAFRNAWCLAKDLNRTLYWPVVLKHGDTSHGSCGRRVADAKTMLNKYLSQKLHTRPPMSDLFRDGDGPADGKPPIWWPYEPVQCPKPGSCVMPSTQANCGKSLTTAASELRKVKAPGIILGSAFTFTLDHGCMARAPPYHPSVVAGVTALLSKLAPNGYDAMHLRLTEQKYQQRANKTETRVIEWLENKAAGNWSVYVATDSRDKALQVTQRAAAAASANFRQRSGTNASMPRITFLWQKDLDIRSDVILGHLSEPEREKISFMLPLLVDTILCAHARRFIGTRGSTFSNHIVDEQRRIALERGAAAAGAGALAPRPGELPPLPAGILDIGTSRRRGRRSSRRE